MRLDNAHVPSAKITGIEDCYKIKLRASGYRLVYQIIDARMVVRVISVGKRDKNAAYMKALQRALE